MKRKSHRKVVHHKASVVRKPKSSYLMWIRGWMFLVMFALMLGVGAIVGNFINQQLGSAPVVAGVQTIAR